MFNHLKLMKTTLLFVMAVAIFSACQKEEVTPKAPTKTESVNFFQMQSQNNNNLGNGVVTEEDSLEMDCFSP